MTMIMARISRAAVVKPAMVKISPPVRIRFKTKIVSGTRASSSHLVIVVHRPCASTTLFSISSSVQISVSQGTWTANAGAKKGKKPGSPFAMIATPIHCG